MKNLSLIAAVGKNKEIGFKNDLIWKISEDLKFFKNITMNSYILMGKNTYFSLPKKLFGRKYVVISSTLRKEDDTLIIFKTVEEALKFIESKANHSFFVIGGGQIYSAFLDYVDTMYLTEISESFEQADTFFPNFNIEDWDAEKEPVLYEKNISYRHVKYKRKQ